MIVAAVGNKTYKRGDLFTMTTGLFGIPTNQPCIVLREATFKEYLTCCKEHGDTRPREVIKMSAKRREANHFYEVSTD